MGGGVGDAQGSPRLVACVGGQRVDGGFERDAELGVGPRLGASEIHPVPNLHGRSQDKSKLVHE